jgi:hypothetical protein
MAMPPTFFDELTCTEDCFLDGITRSTGHKQRSKEKDDNTTKTPEKGEKQFKSGREKADKQ